MASSDNDGPTRKLASRGSRAQPDDDPQREIKTAQQRALRPDSKSQSQLTLAGERRKAQEAPTGPMTRAGTSSGAEDDEDDGSYSTGSNYERPQTFDPDAEGLDALDPELDEPPGTFDPGEESEIEDANATHAGPPLKLEIVAGPDTGRKKKFRTVRMVIGRTPGVDLQLTDQSVSRRHVELVRDDNGVLLRDLGSGNGTKVNGQKVSEHMLKHGDEIGIGNTKLRFIDEAGAIAALRDDARAAEEKTANEDGADDSVAGGDDPDGEGDAEAADGDEGEASDDSEAEGNEPADPDSSDADSSDPDTAEEGAEGEHTADAPPPAAAVPLRERFMALPAVARYAVLSALAALVLLGVVAYVFRPRPPSPEEVAKKQAAEKMQLARDAVKAEHYDEAIAFIDQAEALVPGVDQTRLRVQARNELTVVNALAEVKEAMEQHRYEDARTLLAKVPPGSTKTEERKKKLFDELNAEERDYRRRRFDEMMAAGELDAAEQALTALPSDVQRELQPRLIEARGEALELKRQEAKQAAKAAAQEAEVRKTQRAEAVSEAFAVVQRKFAGQEWQRAALECDRVLDSHPDDDEIRKRARYLQTAIPSYGRAYEEGIKKHRVGPMAVALRPLKKAWELYQQVNFASPMGDELRAKLAEASVAAADDAKHHNDLATAAILYRDALKLDPDVPRASRELEALKSQVDELYQKAYMLKDSEPAEAKKLFRLVTEIAPAGSTTYEKAKNQLAAMAP